MEIYRIKDKIYRVSLFMVENLKAGFITSQTYVTINGNLVYASV